jgi:hypothetical protein
MMATLSYGDLVKAEVHADISGTFRARLIHS